MTRRALEELVSLQRGNTYQSALLDRPGPVLLGLASIARDGGFRKDSLRTYGGDSPEKLLVRPGDLYVSLKDVTQSGDLLGSVARVPTTITCGRLTQDTVRLTLLPGSPPRDYVYWVLRSPEYRAYCRAHSIGTTNLSLPREDFLSFEVPSPSRAQLALVAALEALEAKLDLNRQMNVTLEEMARGLFKSWFVEFDPVRARMRGRVPFAVDATIMEHFTDRIAADDVPVGWTKRPLGDLIDVLETGSRPPGGIKGIRSGVPSVGAESIVGIGQFDYAKTRYIPREFFDGMAKGHIEDRDVLLYKDGGRPGEFEPHVAMFGDGFPFSEFAINEHVYRIRARPPLTQLYLYFQLGSEAVMDEMRRKGTGVAIPGLNSTAARSLSILVPPPAIVSAFDALAGPMASRIFLNGKESRTLVELRDLLLPKLLSGELRIRDAEKAVQKVL